MSLKSSQNSQGVKDIVVEGSNNYYILSFARVLRRLPCIANWYRQLNDPSVMQV